VEIKQTHSGLHGLLFSLYFLLLLGFALSLARVKTTNSRLLFFGLSGKEKS
jgi:hypothetical protein